MIYRLSESYIMLKELSSDQIRAIEKYIESEYRENLSQYKKIINSNLGEYHGLIITILNSANAHINKDTEKCSIYAGRIDTKYYNYLREKMM